MTSRFEVPSHRFNRFEQAQARLSDDLVSHVLPRGQSSSLHVGGDACDRLSTKGEVGEKAPAMLSVIDTTASRKRLYDDMTRHHMNSPYSKLALSSRRETDSVLLGRQPTRSEIRREQCRTNQARYRNRQRNNQLRLENAVQQLRLDLDSLKQTRQSILLAKKTSQSPWTIVSEVFRIVESSFRSPWSMENEDEMHYDVEARKNLKFLHEVFTSDVAVCELAGIEALVERWRHYSMHLGDARIRLERVESVAPGIMTATAKFSLTTSELVMRRLLPHLPEVEPQSKYDALPSTVRDRLLGKSLNCSLYVDFFFDEENGRVTRLEPKLDAIPELFRILGDLDDVSEVFSVPTNSTKSGRLSSHRQSLVTWRSYQQA
ncbi:hypothetical protein ON010_g6408 [Phytophthora cinnamomi]|nr:hypothetical protein ON010_g6408 [Phytophthora cinnamomi]